MSFGPGTIFKHYRIERLIGKGGMGEVYLAEETTLGRKVAIKVLKQEATTDPRFVERFRNEARVLGQLNHPNIVGLLTFFEEAGIYYLVMQYAPGITLAELIRRTGPIPEQRAMRIFAQLAEALTFAHSEGVVHRDIKPSNIMVDPDKNDRVMVMDFGIARLMDAQHITRTGAQLGTPCYMSPEQVLGKKEVGPPSDVYSAGVVLYEMLSGTLPYDLDTESLYTVQDRILKDPLPDPRRVYEYISDKCVSLVKDLTQKDPDQRPKSITAALHSGHAMPAPAPVIPTPVRPSQQPQAQKQARWQHSGYHPPVYNPDASESPDPEVVIDPRKKRSGTGKIMIRAAVAVVIVVTALYFLKAFKRQEVEYEHVSALEVIPEMITVTGGTFSMGSNDGEYDEKPVHQVTVSSFMIGKYEVTQKEWREVMGSNPSVFSGDDLPVEEVSWYDAVDYCNKRSQKEGLTPCYSGSGTGITCNWNANGYRLPTEAEWEFAARGGTKSKGYTFSGFNDIGSVAWYDDNSGNTTHPVGSKIPNELGIHDMSGNVWEWCWDWYDKYPESRSSDPKGAGGGSYRVLRGGSWCHNGNNCRVATRRINDPDYWNYSSGLRVSRAIK